MKNVLERNVLWIPKMISAHLNKTGPILFMMGASHLYCPDEYGILNLLTHIGFKIRIMNTEGQFVHYNRFLPLSSSSMGFLKDLKGYAEIMGLILDRLILDNTPLLQGQSEIIVNYLRDSWLPLWDQSKQGGFAEPSTQSKGLGNTA